MMTITYTKIPIIDNNIIFLHLPFEYYFPSFLDVIPTDPWWILHIMPPIYWISIVLAQIDCLIALKFNKMMGAWLCILLLTALSAIPKLLFSNPMDRHLPFSYESASGNLSRLHSEKS
jgi:hypothetical protein